MTLFRHGKKQEKCRMDVEEQGKTGLDDDNAAVKQDEAHAEIDGQDTES